MNENQIINKIKDEFEAQKGTLQKIVDGKIIGSTTIVAGIGIDMIDPTKQKESEKLLNTIKRDTESLTNQLKNASIQPLCYFTDLEIETLKAQSYYDIAISKPEYSKATVDITYLTKNTNYLNDFLFIIIGGLGWIGWGITLYHFFDFTNPFLFCLSYAFGSFCYLLLIGGLVGAILEDEWPTWLERSFISLISPIYGMLDWLDKNLLYSQNNLKNVLFKENSNQFALKLPLCTTLPKNHTGVKSFSMNVDVELLQPNISDYSDVQNILGLAYKNALAIGVLVHKNAFSIKLPIEITSKYSAPIGPQLEIVHYVRHGSVCAAISAYIGQNK